MIITAQNSFVAALSTLHVYYVTIMAGILSFISQYYRLQSICDKIDENGALFHGWTTVYNMANSIG